MNVSLKGRNAPLLGAVLFTNLAICIWILRGNKPDVSWIEEVTAPELSVPLLVLTGLAGVLNSQIGHLNKARLIFWRWSHPLPGSRAFTVLMHTDPRIDIPRLLTCAEKTPSDPQEQNRLWFRWYREFQDEPSVSGVHGSYLLFRDWACLTIAMFATLCPLTFWHAGLEIESITLMLVFVTQYLMVRRSAIDRGNRLVTTVLACKASSFPDLREGGMN